MKEDDFFYEEAIQTSFPYPKSKTAPKLSKQEKMDLIASRFRDIMIALGLDLDHPSLARTPERVAKMYVNEVFTGLDDTTFPSLSFVDNEFRNSENGNIVFIKVNFNSFCEHHFVPISGNAYVAYIPKDKVIGLSKIPRIVRFFAQRPQMQERLGAQISDSLQKILGTEDVAVCIAAKHYCMIARGIEDAVSHTITYVLKGAFEKDLKRREEFYQALKAKDLD
ncbi:GTP cyclohydrolase I FolE [Criblamydia sequanensis]|uniref:GTP cyclohydrolase 1 n=1 Tax=Candidatus Criblamydia sequanensis CRIB-18 TaxID=1437425 RepID=A0A090CYC7_9BACT|nr:GTP cyclohydrolase I FolE [Criblamydia sequanensis]CDR33507.1 GTP cyclohydrolase I [Criblamydia sequanensis CRIB-18]